MYNQPGVTRYFIDSEFMEDGETIIPLSLALVSDDGREFYYEFDDVDHSLANEFVTEHVLPNLFMHQGQEPWKDVHWPAGIANHKRIKEVLLEFVRNGKGTPEFWGYFSDYDWVLFCQLFGRMVDLPQGWPFFCLDLRQEIYRLESMGTSVERIQQYGAAHNALYDARWIKEQWIHTMDVARSDLRAGR